MKAWEHYFEAEKHIAASEYARQQAGENGDDVEMACAMHEAAIGQVHATLALAGATAMQAYSRADDPELDDWAEAAGGTR